MKRRLILTLVAFLALVTAGAFLGDAWHEADWWVFERLTGGEAPPLSEDVAVVDVGYDPALPEFRRRVAAALTRLAARPEGRPHTVVVDIAIQNEPQGLEGLLRAVTALRDQGVAVYGAVNPYDASMRPDPGYMENHARSFYARLDGKGHTRFDYHSATPTYPPFVELEGELGRERLDALAVVLAARRVNRAHGGSPDPIVLHLGERDEMRRRILTFHEEAGRPPEFLGPDGKPASSVRLNGKLVVVGSLARDRTGFLGLSGPEVLAMAISERMLPADAVRQPRLLAGPALLAMQVLGFAALVALAFRLTFLRFRRLRHRPGLLAGLAATFGLGCLGMWVAVMASLGHVVAQVTLPAFAVLTAAGLCWHVSHHWLLHRLLMPEAEAAASDIDEYDIFISYSRQPENAEWVTANLFQPLTKATVSGRPLRVFFDQCGIPPGNAWFPTLARAIQGSRVFVPIYSEDYFAKDFCRWEMQKAAIRHVSDSGFVFPISRGKPIAIPVEYDDIQFLDITNEPRFVDLLLVHLEKRMR